MGDLHRGGADTAVGPGSGGDGVAGGRRVGNLVHPGGIGAGGYDAVFGVGPFDGVGSGRDGSALLLPIDRSADTPGLFHVIDIESQVIVIGFRRDPPIKGQCAWPGQRCLHPRVLTVGDITALGRINAIVGNRGLAVPVGVAAGSPGQARIIQRHAQGWN